MTLLYIYHALISPSVASYRLERLQDAREDIGRLIQQFHSLRYAYEILAVPPISVRTLAASDMGLFIDTIIPAIRENHKRSSDQHEGNEEYLDRLSNNMSTLSDLYNERRNRHNPLALLPRSDTGAGLRLQLRSFRKALGKVIAAPSDDISVQRDDDKLRDKQALLELQSLLVGDSELHIVIPDDPLNDLGSLDRLEQVIIDLKDLEAKPENRTYCDDARQYLSSNPAVGGRIQLGDSLTLSFPLYPLLAMYTPLKDPLKFAPEYGLRSYSAIKLYLRAPFEVKTISDLDQLSDYAGVAIEKTITESQSGTIDIPFIDTRIDRSIILAAVPMLMVVLFHVISYYVIRSAELIREIGKSKHIVLDRNDFRRLGPHSLLHPLSRQWFSEHNFSLITLTGLANLISFIFNLAVRSVPIALIIGYSVSLYFFWNTFQYPFEIISMVLIGVFTLFFMTVEVLLIDRSLG
ncbi:MAG: hypothetical protein MN733_13585 [Nitrososphaera sp.]|nr:hypothetical protein [Nitrososphaera sp.]